MNLATTSSPPPPSNETSVKRKRGRPRKDENLTQPETNLVGKMVSGMVVGCFDSGYLLQVKVNDTDMNLAGLVFMPGKVVPITPENDLAPHVKMYERQDTDDQEMTDAVTETTQALALIPQENNGEAVMEKEKEEEEEGGGTRLVEFFPTPDETKEQQKSPGESRGFDLMAEEQVCGGEKVPEELQLELGNKTIMSEDNNGNHRNVDRS